jgi:hypothetical protein
MFQWRHALQHNGYLFYCYSECRGAVLVHPTIYCQIVIFFLEVKFKANIFQHIRNGQTLTESFNDYISYFLGITMTESLAAKTVITTEDLKEFLECPVCLRIPRLVHLKLHSNLKFWRENVSGSFRSVRLSRKHLLSVVALPKELRHVQLKAHFARRQCRINFLSLQMTNILDKLRDLVVSTTCFFANKQTKTRIIYVKEIAGM